METTTTTTIPSPWKPHKKTGRGKRLLVEDPLGPEVTPRPKCHSGRKGYRGRKEKVIYATEEESHARVHRARSPREIKQTHKHESQRDFPCFTIRLCLDTNALTLEQGFKPGNWTEHRDGKRFLLAFVLYFVDLLASDGG